MIISFSSEVGSRLDKDSTIGYDESTEAVRKHRSLSGQVPQPKTDSNSKTDANKLQGSWPSQPDIDEERSANNPGNSNLRWAHLLSVWTRTTLHVHAQSKPHIYVRTASGITKAGKTERACPKSSCIFALSPRTNFLAIRKLLTKIETTNTAGNINFTVLLFQELGRRNVWRAASAAIPSAVDHNKGVTY